jgi:hypothetical protein
MLTQIAPSAKRPLPDSFAGCTTGGMDGSPPAKEFRIVTLSAIAGFLAPLCFVAIFAMRKIRRRVHVHFNFWGKRIKAELARWS